MQDSSAPRLAKWPFFLGNALLLALAGFIFFEGKRPFGPAEVLACVLCVGVGAVFSIWPFVLEYRSAEKLLETVALTSVVAQVQNLDAIATQISDATAQWQSVQEAADKTARQAGDIAKKMAEEAAAFNEFIQHANDNEKSTLRLEVDKLRRVESEWLQVLVRILDHVYALNRAAAQSRQPTVIDQLGRFQSACQDAARRVGLAPFVAAQGEPFDVQKHQVVEGEVKPGGDAVVGDTAATGYTFQGKIIRPALVRLLSEEIAPEALTEMNTATTSQPTSTPEETELPLE